MGKCEKHYENISLLVDDLLDEKMKKELIKHLETCEDCNEHFKLLKRIKNEISEIEQIELPENFHEEFMIKLNQNVNFTKSTKREKRNKKSNIIDIFRFKNNKNIITIAASFIGLLFIISIGKNYSDIYFPNNKIIFSNDPEIDTGYVFNIENRDYSSPNNMSMKYGLEGSDNAETDFILDYNISIEVSDLNKVLKEINSLSGTNIDSNIKFDSFSGNAFIVRQIEINNLDNDIEKIHSFGRVTNLNTSKSKISSELIDLEANRDNLLNQRNNLLEYMKKVVNIEEMELLDNRISSLDYQINQCLGSINSLKTSTQNPKIFINLYVPYKTEKEKQDNKNIFEKMKIAFTRSLNDTAKFFKNLILFIASFSVQISVFFIIVIIFIYFIKNRRRGNQ